MTPTTKNPEGRSRDQIVDSDGMSGGAEPLPVCGHLGSGESLVKPTFRGRFFLFAEGG